MYTLDMCNGGLPMPPAPPAPTITLTAAPSADSVYAGQANGAAVYATPSTAQENMAAVDSQLQKFYTDLAVTKGLPQDPGGPCGGFWSFLDPACVDVMPWLIGGAVLIGGMLLLGGRRR